MSAAPIHRAIIDVVEAFWVCQHCRSLNRAGTSRCYHCHEKQGTAPPEAGSAAPSSNVTHFPGSPSAPSAAGPHSPSGPTRGGNVVTYFADSPAAANVDNPPGYVSAPVPTPLAPAPDYTTRYREAAAAAARRRGFHRPQLTGPIRRRLSSALATRPFVGIRFVGYVSAILATLILLDAALLVATFGPVAQTALQAGSLTTAMSQVSSPATLQVMVGGLVVLGLVGLAIFSAFIGLSTHNAPGLGAQAPYMSPARATTCWSGILWAQLFVAASLLAPAALISYGYPLPGLIVALVAVELVQRHLDDLFGWLTHPARHVADLLVKLDTSGSTRSLVGSAWRYSFVAANALAIVALALPLAVIAAVAVADLAGRQDLVAWPGSSSGPVQITIMAVLGLLTLMAALATILLVPVSIELVGRQQTRRGLARMGRARPWASRDTAQAVPEPRVERAVQDPYSERAAEDPYYRRAAQDPYSERAVYDPYDNPRPAPRYGDQASLNSPSTTSSFPWDEGSSDEGSSD
jgi:hypothetical protein